MARWRFTAVTRTGSKHKKMGIECQDYSIAQCSGDRLILLTSDGAGSATHSAEGSAHLCQQLFGLISQAEEVISLEFLERAVSAVRESLRHKARAIEGNLRDFAATLVGFVVDRGKCHGFQVGDGAIVYRPSHTEPFRFLTLPDNGFYPNETFFVTSDSWKEHFQYHCIETEICQVALFTDGIQNIAVSQKTGSQPHDAFFKPLFDFFSQAHHQDEVQHQLAEFLDSDRVCGRTDDDKSLILAIAPSFGAQEQWT